MFAATPKEKVEPAKQPKEPVKKPVPQVQKKLSLFGDSDSDEDIFSTATSKPPLVAPSKVLFDDDDLFQTPKPEVPKDDSLFLFSPQKAEKVIAKVEEKVEEKITAPAPRPKIQEKPKPVVSEPVKKIVETPIKKPAPVNLFDSPEEETPSPIKESEDLFGEQKPPAPVKVQTVAEDKKEEENEIAKGEKTPEPELPKCEFCKKKNLTIPFCLMLASSDVLILK